MSSTPVLYQLRFSHFNEKGRWTLDYKGIAHERHSLLAGLHARKSKKLGGQGTTPVLDLGVGNVVADTTEIIAWAEREKPDPPLYPDDPAERQRALALEEHFDEELGPPLRSAVFHAILPHRRVTVAMTTQGLGAGPRVMSNLMYPGIRRAVAKALNAGDDNFEATRRKTVEGLDRLESELGGSDYLAGERFSNADLTAAALFFPLVSPPQFQYELPDPWPPEWEEFRASLSDRSGYQWVGEMWRRHRGASAEVA